MLDTFQGFLLFIVFLVPGFIFRTIEGQFAYIDKRLEWGKFALGLLARSTVVYSIAAPWIYQIWSEHTLEPDPLLLGYLIAAVALLLPVPLGFAAGVARQFEWPRRIIEKFGLETFEAHRIPTAWDRVFSKITNSWIVVTFNDETQVYGWYGDESYVSSDPDERDLFISHVVKVSENGDKEFVENTKGVYINARDIRTIEFIDQPSQKSHEHRDE